MRTAVTALARRLAALTCLISIGWLCSVANAADAGSTGERAARRALAIVVEPGDWGRAAPADIERVLYSAANALVRFFPEREFVPVRVISGAQHPRVFFAKGGQGEYVVQLSAKDRRWAQYAYQFAHEFCHILARFDNKEIENGRPARNQWFEETLCEIASVHALRSMSRTWQSSPPVPHWADYAPALAEFANTVLAARSREAAAETTLAGFYSEHRSELAGDPNEWDRNEVCAQLLLPLFDEHAGSLGAIGYLNAERSAASSSFPAYLASWRRAVPAGQRDFVDRLIGAFGLGTETRVAQARP